MTIPTGRRETRDGIDHAVYTRTFRAPIDDVWAAVTEPDRLERWIGTLTGDPASGEVDFRMTAEGDDVPVETFVIDTCEPPRLLVTHTFSEQEQTDWHFTIALAENAGVTTLTFSQSVPNADLAVSICPGWDYYLDRLVAAESGDDAGSVDWDDYYPSQAEHYRALFS